MSLGDIDEAYFMSSRHKKHTRSSPQRARSGFYFFQNITIDENNNGQIDPGESLDEEDWIGAFKKYDESQGGECTNDEINFDETLGGMCSSSNEGFICTPGFPNCYPEDCPPEIDVDNDGQLWNTSWGNGIIITKDGQIVKKLREETICAWMLKRNMQLNI